MIIFFLCSKTKYYTYQITINIIILTKLLLILLYLPNYYKYYYTYQITINRPNNNNQLVLKLKI
jgi:hypothetical protein